MKIILRKDVKNLGKAGDIKEVANGYAMNCLIPQNLAEVATENSIKKAAAAKSKQVEKEQADLESTQKLAEETEGREIVIHSKEKEGKLFGSITAKDIAKELKKENIAIAESSIKLENPIKETGEYEVQIELGHGIESSLRLIVEGE